MESFRKLLHVSIKKQRKNTNKERLKATEFYRTKEQSMNSFEKTFDKNSINDTLISDIEYFRQIFSPETENKSEFRDQLALNFQKPNTGPNLCDAQYFLLSTVFSYKSIN